MDAFSKNSSQSSEDVKTERAADSDSDVAPKKSAKRAQKPNKKSTQSSEASDDVKTEHMSETEHSDSEDADSDFDVAIKSTKRAPPKSKVVDSDSDSDVPKKKASKKVVTLDSDSESDVPKKVVKKAAVKKTTKVAVKKTTKAPSKKSKNSDSSEDDFKAEIDSDEPVSLASRARPGRAKPAAKKYTFSDSESE
jgi:hypothetical protein